MVAKDGNGVIKWGKKINKRKLINSVFVLMRFSRGPHNQLTCPRTALPEQCLWSLSEHLKTLRSDFMTSCG